LDFYYPRKKEEKKEKKKEKKEFEETKKNDLNRGTQRLGVEGTCSRVALPLCQRDLDLLAKC